MQLKLRGSHLRYKVANTRVCSSADGGGREGSDGSLPSLLQSLSAKENPDSPYCESR